jgi:putative acetyltransferase
VLFRRPWAWRFHRGQPSLGHRPAGDTELSDTGFRIVRDDLTHPQVIALIELHLRSAFENSPPGAVFALDLSGLRDPLVTLWSMWDGDDLLGLGALKQLDAAHGEIKSMRTAPAHLRRGVAGMMLDHLLAEARGRGYRCISLETGSTEAFAPARALYERTGFAETGPFADYTDTGFSRYYTLELA